MDKLKLDDPVGAISVHGVVGIWGVLAVPLNNGDASFGAQLIGIVGIFGWVFIASLVVWLVLKAVMGIRVSEEEEYEASISLNAVWKPTPSLASRNKLALIM